MKKKIIVIAIASLLAVSAVVGTTLAYFTDVDNKINIFTSGKVDITLNEVFDEDTAQLIPGVEIQKNVTITLEEGSVDSYVWYTYAIPAALDLENGKVVHVNHAGRNSLAHRNDSTYWADGQSNPTDVNQCWIVDYDVQKNVEIDGVLYNVYTVLYNGMMKAGEETTIGMTKVYCDTAVDFDNDSGKYTFNGQEIDFDLNNVKIIVTAYGIQAATFEDVKAAYEAYNTTGGSSVSVDID